MLSACFPSLGKEFYLVFVLARAVEIVHIFSSYEIHKSFIVRF